jgi:hypothetical protein
METWDGAFQGKVVPVYILSADELQTDSFFFFIKTFYIKSASLLSQIALKIIKLFFPITLIFVAI